MIYTVTTSASVAPNLMNFRGGWDLPVRVCIERIRPGQQQYREYTEYNKLIVHQLMIETARNRFGLSATKRDVNPHV